MLPLIIFLVKKSVTIARGDVEALLCPKFGGGQMLNRL